MEYLSLPLEFGMVETLGGDVIAGKLEYIRLGEAEAIGVSVPRTEDCPPFYRCFPLGRVHSITTSSEAQAALWADELAKAGRALDAPPSLLFAVGGELTPPTLPGAQDDFPF